MNLNNIYAALTLSADKAGPRSTSKLLNDSTRVKAMTDAFDHQVKRNTKGKKQGSDVILESPFLKQVDNREAAVADILANGGDDYASNGMQGDRNQIFINPNLDESAFLHELGHIASRQGRSGSFVRTMRDNPKLTKALAQAALIAPFSAAALIPGDDDMLASAALGVAASAPTLIDEAMATQNALSMMKSMGTPATTGQRARMAGGYMTYLAPALLGGIGGNLIGNLADNELTSLLGYG